mmetsp:Transcript_88724/g.249901  ORF Transcript_88724/g.249901 Transcript_88724/m.249901 type:complete len:297 (+) Transcript_88724:924-1814(+)
MHAVLHFDLVLWGDLEAEGNIAEAQVFGGNETVEENIDALADGKGHRHDAVRSSGPPEATHEVRKVIEHGQVVLNDDDVIVHLLESTNHVCGLHALLHVEVGRRLVEHIDVGGLYAEHGDGEALQLTARKVGDATLLQVRQLELLVVVSHLMIFTLRRQHLSNRHVPKATRDPVHVLRLDHRLEAVFEEAREVGLQLAAPEVRQELRPIWRGLESPQVRLQLARQHGEGRRLADAIGTDKAQNLPRPGRRQAVQLEGVRTIAVGGVLGQVLRQVDDADRLKGALLHADATAYAEGL